VAKKPRLEILEKIDSGLYGRVFKARQADLDRIVAVKVIKREYAHQADAVEHARALARVGAHPNIVTVHAVEEIGIDGAQVTAMIMEWLEGEQFGVRLAGPRFSEQELRRICVGLLDGMDRMHSSGVCHGDLHFGNVILSADCHPKIIDIDATKTVSLSRLSSISREGAIAADADYCRQLVARAFAHSVLGPSVVNELDSELQGANSLDEVRGVAERYLNGPRTPSYSVSPKRAAVPATADDLTARVQEYIENGRPASLYGLVMGQVRLFRDELMGDRFPATARQYSKEFVQERVRQYEECVGPLLPALSTGCYWGDEGQWNLWKQCIETAANCYEDIGIESRSGNRALLDLRLYPPLLLWYACGLGAFMNHRFSTLRFLHDSLDYVYGGERRPLWPEIRYWITEQTPLWNEYVMNNARNYTPVNDHLCDLFYRAFSHLSPLRATFDIQFDTFEYFLGLMDTQPQSTPDTLDAPIGSFLWRQARTPDFGHDLVRQAENRGIDWAPFQAGLFDKNKAILSRVVEVFDAYVDSQRVQRHVRMIRR